MNNPRILSTSPRAAFGINFQQKTHNNSYEEIDEGLFDISGRKISFEPITKSLSSADVSEDDDESDSSSQRRSLVAGSGHNNNKFNKNNHVSRKTKSCKKEELNDSDNDSLREFSTTTKSKKSTRSIKKSSSPTTSAASVASEDSNETPEKKQKSLYKTELCRNWEETSHCRYGMKCQYAHGAADLRELDRHPKYKTQKCRTFHHTGSCPYGARCTFRHFNLPGDALEMKNLEKQEEEEKKQLEKQQQLPHPSVFDNQKVLEQNWFLGAGFGAENKRNLMINNTIFDPEDSLLPSNAESLLPHELLFDLEKDEEQPIARCPLRNYVNLPSFSNFQVPSYHPQPQQQQPQMNQPQQCQKFFRPWLF